MFIFFMFNFCQRLSLLHWLRNIDFIFTVNAGILSFKSFRLFFFGTADETIVLLIIFLQFCFTFSVAQFFPLKFCNWYFAAKILPFWQILRPGMCLLILQTSGSFVVCTCTPSTKPSLQTNPRSFTQCLNPGIIFYHNLCFESLTQ